MSRSILEFLVVLRHQRRVDLHLWRLESRGRDKLEVGVANQFPGEPEEGLFKVVVGLGRDVVVLEVLFAVEGDGFGLDLAFL